ncbi:hypothetical protein BKA69DRAFT_1060512 [Paraphysoderma sedebokerense]|nr:hypothetical protein BKA69DRAFT_1060512 [Paraphysoderma sedebokerense]
MHAYGTNIEGEWKDVMEAIEKCHTVLHSKHNVKRINTDLRITTRTDKEVKHHLVESLKRVEETVGVPQHLEE